MYVRISLTQNEIDDHEIDDYEPHSVVVMIRCCPVRTVLDHSLNRCSIEDTASSVLK